MVIYRELTECDILDAAMLKASCWDEETAGTSSEKPDIVKEHTSFVKWMKTADENADVRLLYGAFDDEKMVGTVFASFVESKDAPEHGFELNGLWVDQGYRRRGIALTLLKKVCEEFRKLGAKKMIVYNYHIAPSNSFYLKFGCNVISTEYQTKDRLQTDIIEGNIEDLITRLSVSLQKVVSR